MSNHNEHVAPPLKLTPVELQRQVTAPIPPQFMREYFSNNDILFVIDYNASRLKGSVFLMYLTNLAMPVDIKIDLSNYEEYSALMEAYFDYQGVVECNTLAVLAGEIVLHFSGVPADKRLYRSPINQDFVHRFCTENEAAIATWCIFLDSMVTYIGKRLSPALMEEEEVPVVDSLTIIGQNVVNLVRLPDYLTEYFSFSKLEGQLYFKRQFEDAIFGGKTLAYYFFCPSNSITLLLQKENVELLIAGAKATAE
jgi:hypothetical protein